MYHDGVAPSSGLKPYRAKSSPSRGWSAPWKTCIADPSLIAVTRPCANRSILAMLCAVGLSFTGLGCAARGDERPSQSTPADGVGGAHEADSGAMAGSQRGCEVVEFESAVVESTVRDLVNAPSGPVTGATVAGIVSLTIQGTPDTVASLAGVECMTSLRDLTAVSAGLTSLEPLRELAQLETVNVTDNAISDLSPLNDKPRLRGVMASQNEVSDVSTLELPDPPEYSLWCESPDINLGDNPIDAEGVANLCNEGWSVAWGPFLPRGEYQICNIERMFRCGEGR